MRFFSVLRHSAKEDWGEAVYCLLYTILGGFMPIYLTWLFFVSLRQPISLSLFSDHGEFALYSAAFLSGSLYVVLRDFKSRIFPSRSFFVLLFVLGIVIGVSVYMGFSYAKCFPSVIDFNNAFLRHVSVWLLCLSCFFSFIIVVIDNTRLNADVQSLAGKAFDKLDQDFQKL